MTKRIKRNGNDAFYYGESLYVCIAYGFSPIAIGYEVYSIKNNQLHKGIATVRDRRLLLPVLRAIMTTNHYL